MRTSILMSKELDPICAERKIGPVGTLDVCSMTRDGLPKRRKVYPMHSMTMNYWRIIAAEMGVNMSPGDVQNTNGSYTSRPSGTAGANAYSIDTSVGQNRGIRLGTGSTAVALTDYTLDSIIGHGTSAGQLNALETFAGATDTTLTGTRAFENLSGGTINIREIGLMAYRSGNNSTIMLARDVLPENFPVENNEVVTATITMFVGEGNRNMHRMFPAMLSGSSWASTFYNREGGTNSEYASLRNTVTSSGSNRNIVLGTGNAALDFEGINLDAPLLHGSDSNQLLYGATTAGSLTLTSTYIAWEVQRTVLNSSGQTYNITEMALFTSGSDVYMLDRFLLPSAIPIADGQNRQLRWRFLYSIA